MSADIKPVTQPRRSGGSKRTWQRIFMNIHTAIYRLTGGVLGGKALKWNFLLLTTIGRKSGRERVTPIFYWQDGGSYMLVASNWGAPRDPVWWLNLQAHPEALVQVGRRRIPVTARAADPEEHARLWTYITARFKNFEAYQQGTARQIPIIILTPQA